MASTIGSTSTDASGNTYKVVLADDFSNGYLKSNWGDAYDGGVYWNGAFTWSNDDVAVRNGEMQVTMTRHSDGSWTGGGFSSFKADKTITYGVVEFDARMEEAQGTQCAILMWPKSDAWPDDGEIDILETPQDQSMYSLHWAGGDGSHQYNSQFSSIDASQTHHYKMIWLENSLTIQVDGKTVGKWTDANAIPDSPMGFGAMGYVGASGEEWVGGAPNGSTPSVVTLHLDNVVMSQFTGTGGTPTPDPVTPTNPTPTTKPVTATIGSGSDTLVLKITQDYYKANAQYTIKVDGQQIGSTLSAGALDDSGQNDTITVKGNWGAGSHKVTVEFLNDDFGGSAATDRNLQVNGISFNGTALSNGTADLNSNGAVDFTFSKAGTPSTPSGTAAIPAKFGTPGVWGQESQVWTGDLDFGGTSYKTYGGNPVWGGLTTVQMAPTKWDASWNTHIAVDNFVEAKLDLHTAGTRDLDVMVVSAKRGAVTLADGDDHVTWVAHSNTAGNVMTIKTGGGDDVVHITAAGISPLADYDRYNNGSLYNAKYDGTGSTASVTTGAGKDTVTTEGGVALVLNSGSGFVTAAGSKAADTFYAGTGGGDFTGGAGKDVFVFDKGDSHVVINDFTAGADKLKFVGITKADIHTAAATEGGVSGLLVTYDSTGHSVFLEHVTSVAATDMLFA